MKQSSETLTSLSSINEAFIKPFPNSTKVYVKGSRDDIRVPMRQIKLTDTIGDLAEKNDPIHVYDTSGPYTGKSPAFFSYRQRFSCAPCLLPSSRSPVGHPTFYYRGRQAYS